WLIDQTSSLRLAGLVLPIGDGRIRLIDQMTSRKRLCSRAVLRQTRLYEDLVARNDVVHVRGAIGIGVGNRDPGSRKVDGDVGADEAGALGMPVAPGGADCAAIAIGALEDVHHVVCLSAMAVGVSVPGLSCGNGR